MRNDEPTDLERYPTLTDAGREMLSALREHPAAPIYRNQSGNRLTTDDLRQLRDFEQQTLDADIDWRPGTVPDWVEPLITQAFREVPHYRALGTPPRRLEDVAPVARADLAADIAAFVPDSVPVDRLINFRTTGTTGHPLLVPSHPMVAARYLVFHKRALRRFGMSLTHGRGQVGVVLLGHQRKCFTYVSVTPLMDESGLAKINLHPDDWRHPDDRARYLEALEAEVIAGDPISFAVLLQLSPAIRPKVLVSVSMSLSPALRAELAQRFGCPVLDVYSLNEVGPVAVLDDAAGGHVMLQPRLYVELLDAHGQPVAPGERGEITVTGGFNFCLPLLRYRTGDHGTLQPGIDAPVVVGLAGRSPVRYRASDGQWFNNIDVTHALAPLPLARFALHQAADSRFTLQLPAEQMNWEGDARTALAPLVGAAALDVRAIDGEPDKLVQYTSALEGAFA